MVAPLNQGTELSKKMKVVDQGLTDVIEAVDRLWKTNDFNLVVDFKTHAEVSIIEVAGLLGVKARRAVTALQSLADVLYVREIEAGKEIGNWRAEADNGKMVAAVKILRESTGHLSIEEAKNVIGMYLIHKF